MIWRVMAHTVADSFWGRTNLGSLSGIITSRKRNWQITFRL